MEHCKIVIDEGVHYMYEPLKCCIENQCCVQKQKCFPVFLIKHRYFSLVILFLLQMLKLKLFCVVSNCCC